MTEKAMEDMVSAKALCEHMQKALERGWLKATYDNVDGKGWRYGIDIKIVEPDGEIFYTNIGFCPFCGAFLGVGVMPFGKCRIDDMNECMRENERDSGL